MWENWGSASLSTDHPTFPGALPLHIPIPSFSQLCPAQRQEVSNLGYALKGLTVSSGD